MKTYNNTSQLLEYLIHRIHGFVFWSNQKQSTNRSFCFTQKPVQ